MLRMAAFLGVVAPLQICNKMARGWDPAQTAEFICFMDPSHRWVEGDFTRKGSEMPVFSNVTLLA